MNTKVVYSLGFPISVVSCLCSLTVGVELCRSFSVDLVSSLLLGRGVAIVRELSQEPGRRGGVVCPFGCCSSGLCAVYSFAVEVHELAVFL